MTGRIAFEDITRKTDEVFYWLTILVSNTLGTALGDFVATTAGLGFEGGTLVFASLLVIVAAAFFWLKQILASTLFWAAYVLTRPFGATLGDTLTKPRAEGGLALETKPRTPSSLGSCSSRGLSWRLLPSPWLSCCRPWPCL